MRSIRAKFILLTLSAIIAALSVATYIGVYSIKTLGKSDADQMLHLKCTTGAMNLETYFDDVERSVETVATLVQDNLETMPDEQFVNEVENVRHLFSKIAHNTNGVLTYYFRVDPEFSKEHSGFWYVKQSGREFQEHEVTDITQYDTNDTSTLVWFTIPKAEKKGVWLPPYHTENFGARVISYNVPVYRHGQFVGVVGIEIDYGTLVSEVEKIKLFENGYAFILDEHSNVIYHPQMDSTLQYGEKIAIDTPDAVKGDQHVQYHFNGIKKEAVWRSLSNGMRLYVTVPLGEINSVWQGLISRTLFASFIILLLASFVMMRFADRITKPLHRLTNAAQQVAVGNYDVVLDDTDDDEIGMLTRTFKGLVENTKANIDTLNRKVYIDALTAVRNKAGYGAYMQKIQDLLDSSAQKPEFAIGVFDCDNLKYINDFYGHDKGDIYIKKASQLICRTFQHSPVFRIGGDEFAVILENDDFRNREKLFAQFREKRAEIRASAEHEWEQANISMGAAVYDPETDPAVIDVARRADKAMYENKRLRKENQQARIKT
ncbi:sensor domain-containing diguanylate cyclase [Selenomonas ruminantium]|uniref:sensor domain-containing diguanylate cyclase n=1 Tax=Selenomonas ruminantium TaxID=971 RepID=UPI000479CAB6|nr:diguanylate cyclase [Selenomonas ruminantium]